MGACSAKRGYLNTAIIATKTANGSGAQLHAHGCTLCNSCYRKTCTSGVVFHHTCIIASDQTGKNTRTLKSNPIINAVLNGSCSSSRCQTNSAIVSVETTHLVHIWRC